MRGIDPAGGNWFLVVVDLQSEPSDSQKARVKLWHGVVRDEARRGKAPDMHPGH